MSRVAAAAAALVAAAAVLFWLRRRVTERAAAAVPAALIVGVGVLAAYAWFIREPAGKLADYDAYGLRIFTDAYIWAPVLVAALIGYALLVRRDFWRDPAFVLTFTVFAILFCYKSRIVPTHFWMGRRLVPIVLPGVLLFACAAALWPWRGPRSLSWVARAAGVGFIAIVGWQYTAVAAPVAAHVEYAGLVRYLETLAARFSPRDLVIVEGRDAGSDTHVLAAPLAYLHDRQVLVLESPIPNKDVLEAFLAFALQKYDRVFFVGGGGTDLLSRRIQARPIADEKVQLPEYEVTSWQDFPDEVRRKDFEYSIYELQLGEAAQREFQIDVGFQDDLNVVRFHAKETNDARTVRWTGPQSFVAIPGLSGAEKTLSIVMHNGGRPARAGAARVEVLFDGQTLGTVEVPGRFETFAFDLPADAVRRAGGRDAPVQLTLRSSTWIPRDVLGGTDGRTLGVMVDRLDVR